MGNVEVAASARKKRAAGEMKPITADVEEAAEVEPSTDSVREIKKQAKGKGKGGARARQAESFTREDFMAQAKPIKIEVDGQEVTLDPKKFSTGSCGFFSNSRVELE